MNKKLLKYPMSIVKFLVGLLPKTTRKKLRQNIWLYNLYSVCIQKSGFFFGFPSPQELQRSYLKTVAKQTHDIDIKLENSPQTLAFNCLVVLTNHSHIDVKTIQNVIASLSIRSVFLIGDDKLIKQYTAQFSKVAEYPIQSSQQLTGNELYLPLLLLKGGDILHLQALDMFAYYLAKLDKDTVLYCDIDSIDKSDVRHLAELYPDWNPDLQLATGYIKSGVVLYGNRTLEQFRDFVLENTTSSLIALWMTELYIKGLKVIVEHIPYCLVHQSEVANYQWAKELVKLDRQDFSTVKDDATHVATLKWNLGSMPLVSLIIPTKNAMSLVKNCIDSILTLTQYENFEILLIDNNSDNEEALTYFEYLNQTVPKVRVLQYPHDFNYSAINNFAVQHAKGQVVGLINNDIEVITPEWLCYMMGHVLRTDVGCVGAKLLYPDNRIQHAGVVMGYGGGAGHAHKYFPRDHSGYLNRLIASHNFSAVTAACLLVKKSDYLAVGGLNETDLTVAFNDVDFCLRVLQLGRRNLYCAEAVLYHYESSSRGLDNTYEKRTRFEKELAYLQNKWKSYIDHDPAYNPNLTLSRENFSIKQSSEY